MKAQLDVNLPNVCKLAQPEGLSSVAAHSISRLQVRLVGGMTVCALEPQLVPAHEPNLVARGLPQVTPHDSTGHTVHNLLIVLSCYRYRLATRDGHARDTVWLLA